MDKRQAAARVPLIVQESPAENAAAALAMVLACYHAPVPVQELMERLRTMREHMLVVGSEDNALGIITREDMVEELLGDVDDKYDLTPVTSLPTPTAPQQV